ncbi:DUF397 domain-containing protein [Saccharopolyspora sp. ASAGF58]|uniref:DUF397 domain-containing protein n=1 Tax=Saccharopolyspora sp. ASAGF58 TaxID=2719023 RepID=UPI001440177A|nr:DUF397 domain-containing protein [Saccharopolyspora sp. ASAGF58]QIZ34600.1 DUF397 domain-containing protein [Saccharopolyspora sp. ASAGF58]
MRDQSRAGVREGDCAEVGRIGDGAAVRDTKNRAAGCFTTTAGQSAAFVAAVNADV